MKQSVCMLLRSSEFVRLRMRRRLLRTRRGSCGFKVAWSGWQTWRNQRRSADLHAS